MRRPARPPDPHASRAKPLASKQNLVVASGSSLLTDLMSVTSRR